MGSLLENYILFWICIIGLCLGSFFNVVILRSLSGESLVFPSSKCPKCGNKLKPWHNIPVLSYLFLQGKCAFCKEHISIQYPIVELLTMGLFALSFIKFGISWQTLFSIAFCSFILIMTVTDIKEKIVDCNLAIALAVIGIIYNWICKDALLDSILGLLIAVLIIESIARLGFLVSKNRAMGEADSYVAGALGACFGLSSLVQVMTYSFVASMFFVIPTFIYKQFKNRNFILGSMFILFIICLFLYKFVFQNFVMLTVILIIAMYLIVTLLKTMKQETSPLYLPFVPAFALGALYFLFV